MTPIRGSQSLRRIQAWRCVGGGLILLATIVASDRGPSDHTEVLALAVALLGPSVPQFLWRGRETAYDRVPLAVSIGVAGGGPGDEADVMLSADGALYGAKRAGRDRVMRGRAGATGVRPMLAG